MQIYKWLHGLPQALFQRNALLSAVCAIFVITIAVERVHCNSIFKSINVDLLWLMSKLHSQIGMNKWEKGFQANRPPPFD